jgi:hypothetical protein
MHSFGAAIPQKSNFVESQKLDDEKPMAVFSFKYRDRKALQSLLIIPRTPSPKPETAASDGDDDDSFDLTNLDPKEMKKLKKLYRVIQVRLMALSLPWSIANAARTGQRQCTQRPRHDQERTR